MGSASTLLGYAHERIQQALSRALGSGATLSLPHVLQFEVTEMLRRMIPSAEMVAFGKNGSDVCTLAVRLARLHTGRRMILSNGYHGWQDWFVEGCGFASTGIPERGEALIAGFEFNNAQSVADLFQAHRGRVAVILEPAGPVAEGHNGPVPDADPAFLREVADLAHRHGALVVFDEIMTGFRYRGGSVQHATGVLPDLTCLGKALSNGMPLSALVGRADLFLSCLPRAFYYPTYANEAYSLAAAREALAIYQEQDVPAHVWDYGNRLRGEINQLCRNFDVPGEVIGPPFRMLLAFQESDPRRLRLMQTLVHQELLKQGVFAHLVLIPSLAHDEQALAETCRAYESALGVLAEAMRQDRFADHLQVPLLES
jgi:glutamate-1-semialdehyde aminotransferase